MGFSSNVCPQRRQRLVLLIVRSSFLLAEIIAHAEVVFTATDAIIGTADFAPREALTIAFQLFVSCGSSENCLSHFILLSSRSP